MTYNTFGGTLNLALSIYFCFGLQLCNLAVPQIFPQWITGTPLTRLTISTVCCFCSIFGRVGKVKVNVDLYSALS